ncbi:endo-beta-N-acetylglucosaminidase family protein [Enterococcus sp. AZ177]|uniref:endo-beta-N-acetylglucosaminidase family protein n=1 Tax=unclassified Enterococcus TaxID=2608891 RepID=UPI003D2FC4C1
MSNKLASFLVPVFFLLSFSLVSTQANAVQASPKEPVMMAYYRTWRDVTMPHDANSTLPDQNVTAMTDIPEGVAIVSVFHYVNPGTNQQKFWDTLRDTYVPTLHARGTRVIRTIDIREVWNVPHAGAIPTTEEYDRYAQQLIDTYLTPWNLDGLDIDMESSLTAKQEAMVAGTFKALSQHLGPNANTGKLLIYDTNKDNHSLFQKVASYVDYLFIQAYGRPASSLDKTWNTYKSSVTPQQFLPGISFPEEQDHNRWNDTVEPYETSRAYSYAKWHPKEGQKGGMFVYAIDRDGKQFGDDTITKTDFSWTKRLINTMNTH